MGSVIRRPSYWLPIVVLVCLSLNANLLSEYLDPDRAAEAQPSLQSASPIVPVTAATGIPATGSPTIVPVPSNYDAILRDTKRQMDLLAMQEALQSYRGAHGAYPSTGGEAQTFCEREDDAGCAVLAAVPGLSTEDNLSFSYWYVSDGRSFTAYAPAETATTGCSTEQLPGWLASSTFYCRTSQGVAE